MLQPPPADGNVLPPSACILAAERELRDRRRELVGKVRDLLLDAGIPASLFRRGTRLIWREPGDRVGELHVGAYLAPDGRDPDAPLILRATENRDFWGVPATAVRALGLLPTSRPGDVPHIPSRLELSLLPSEAPDFAPWLAAWILARQQLHGGLAPEEVYLSARSILLKPPVPFERVLGDVRLANYLWTRTAARRHDCYSLVREVRRPLPHSTPAALREDWRGACAVLERLWQSFLDDDGSHAEALADRLVHARDTADRLRALAGAD
jgi:hypothetical protein